MPTRFPRGKAPALAMIDKVGIVILVIAFIGALALHTFLGIGLGLSFLIFFVGWPLIGTFITIDDDLKGGWSNPDGTVPPPWSQAPFWGQVIAGLALSSFGGAIDVGWNKQNSIWFWILGAIGFAIAAPMIRKGFQKNGG